MDFLNGKAGELTVGKLLLVVLVAAAGAFALVCVFKYAFTTKNIVKGPNGRDFVVTSWFGPMSTKSHDAYVASKVKALADANAKETKTT